MSKFLRDLQKIAEEEGFEYQGYGGAPGSASKQRGGPGSGHHVFTHRATGAVVRTASTPRNESNALKMARSNFRGAQKRAGTKAQTFRRWVLKHYKVGLRGQKVVRVRMADLAKEFSDEHPDTPISADHVSVMVGQDPMFKRLEYDRNTGENVISISGPGFGLTKEGDEPEAETPLEETCGQTSYMPDGGMAVCTKPARHEGLHLDSIRRHAWAVRVEEPKEEPEPEIDPVAKAAHEALAAARVTEAEMADEPTAAEVAEHVTEVAEKLAPQPVTIGDMVLPAALAEQLREALSVTDSRAQVEEAKLALRMAQAALGDALAALEGVVVVKRTHGKGERYTRSNIGAKRRVRLEALRQAVKEGRLPERFTAIQVAHELNITEGQSVSMLAAAFANGEYVVRVAASTYELMS